LYDESKMPVLGCYTTAEMTDNNSSTSSNNGG
jgi:hypothetical protein